MPWEIADRADPDAPGPRHEQLAQAADAIGDNEDDRFYVRWIAQDGER